MAVTQPMAFDYEISAAICFLLEQGYDELIVDIPRGEDSLFYSGSSVVAIGEAKNVSKNHWTLSSLFHSGSNIGPILQLWLRRRKGAKMIIFSTVGTDCDLEKKQLRPNPDDLKSIFESTKNFDEVIDDENYTYKEVSAFVNSVLFYEWPHSMVKASVHKWCREHDLPFAQGGIERAIALFQDETCDVKHLIQRIADLS